ncbi:hypothetical protein DBZ36_03520 [Alginatibacterium sediminis]|uniref:DUF1566 domain-containing protein n=1 Tax=Alginatibacterium sediminis TaxID=2164068 RepID=A0A420EFU9_9ALTE|nr:hypothetical protein [Alginatibacterium sediminis]RKF19548.1 hypothetical protein DBZ36_03520 [Alginatibacterium sediminis]
MKIVKIGTLILAMMTSFAGHAGLILRDGGLIYDQEQNLTWLMDANLAKTSAWAGDNLGAGARPNGNGQLNWDAANRWAQHLNISGFNEWRLPSLSVTDTNNSGFQDCDFALNGGTDCGTNVLVENSELAFLFYQQLSNDSICDPLSSGVYSCVAPAQRDGFNSNFIDALTGEESGFDNFLASGYWLNQEYALDTSRAWAFTTNSGAQSLLNKEQYRFAIAVHEGDIASVNTTRFANTMRVPETHTSMLFGLALAGLMLRGQRQRR